jgi:hypothetical protein
MGIIRTPDAVKPFMGILTSIPETVPKAEEQLTALFGPVDSRSEPFLFDLTHYYDDAMGTPIYRYFLSFAALINPSTIANIKIKTSGAAPDQPGSRICGAVQNCAGFHEEFLSPHSGFRRDLRRSNASFREGRMALLPLDISGF